MFPLEKRKDHTDHQATTQLATGHFVLREQKDPLKHSPLSLYGVHRHQRGYTFFLTTMTKRKVDIFETTAYLTCTLSFSSSEPIKDSLSLPISSAHPLHICRTSKQVSLQFTRTTRQACRELSVNCHSYLTPACVNPSSVSCFIP